MNACSLTPRKDGFEMPRKCNPAGKNVPHVCVVCGRSFLAWPYQSERRLCSRACHNESMRREKEPLAERFWRQVQKTDDCWLWNGGLNEHGYGTLTVGSNPNRRTAKAHRVSYELHYGEIPEGLHVCHRCDNPPCVRPDHLFLGDMTANVQDARAKGRLARGGKGPRPYVSDPKQDSRGDQNNRAKLTQAQAAEIRERYAAGGISQRVLAEEYGVHKNSIYHVVNGWTWREPDQRP